MIDTDRLILRRHTLDDFEAWYALLSDQELFRFITKAKASREDSWNRLLRYAGHWSLLGFGLFTVFEKDSGTLIGEAGFADFQRGLGDRFDPYPEAAWIFARAAQGRGYAQEAMAAARAWLDANKPSPRTVCIINPENTPSLALAAKLGYKTFDTATYRDGPVSMLEHTAA
jgi:RimJ/RimL family protein N-acetyltransferase